MNVVPGPRPRLSVEYGCIVETPRLLIVFEAVWVDAIIGIWCEVESKTDVDLREAGQ